MTVDWQGEYELLLSLVLAAIKVPASPEQTHDALLALCEYAEDYEVRLLEWQTGWTDADEDDWAASVAEAQRDSPF